MGQSEIYQLLKNKRLGGCNDFFDKEQIIKLLKEQGVTEGDRYVARHLKELFWFDYLEMIIDKNKKKYRYRIK